MILKKNTTIILKLSLIGAMMVIGSCAVVNRVILQGHIICTSTGQKLMLVHPNLDSQTNYSIISGKLAKQTKDVMECVTSKTDGLALASWHHQKLLTWLQYQETQDSVYYRSPGLMPKNCLTTKWSLYHQITHSFLSLYKMEWTNQKQNYLIGFQLLNLLELVLK